MITLDQVGRTWNQISTGRAVESQGLSGPLLKTVLAQPTIPEVLQALDLLSGEIYASAVGLASMDAETIHRTLLTRLRTVGAPSPAAGPWPMRRPPPFRQESRRAAACRSICGGKASARGGIRAASR